MTVWSSIMPLSIHPFSLVCTSPLHTKVNICVPVQWPEEALLSVSRKFLSGTDLGGEGVGEAIAVMCSTIHTSVAQASDRFFSELRRWGLRRGVGVVGPGKTCVPHIARVALSKLHCTNKYEN